MIQGGSCDSLHSQETCSVEGVLWVPCKALLILQVFILCHCPLTQHLAEYFSFTALNGSRENGTFPKQQYEAEEIRANPYLSSSRNANLVS